MAGVKIDDGYHLNGKVIRAGRDGRELHLACIFYCSRERTDGFVSFEALPVVAALAGLADAPAACARCVAAVGPSGHGLLEPADGGWRVHDYLTHNKSAANMDATRAARAAAGKQGGRGHVKQSKLLSEPTPSEANESKLLSDVLPGVAMESNLLSNLLSAEDGKQIAFGAPLRADARAPGVPVNYVPTTPIQPSLESLNGVVIESSHESRAGAGARGRAKYPPDFLAFMAEYPRPDGQPWNKAIAYAAWKRVAITPAEVYAIMLGVAAWKRGRRWQEGYILRPDRWLDGGLYAPDECPAAWTPPAYQNGRGNGHVSKNEARFDALKAYATGGGDDRGGGVAGGDDSTVLDVSLTVRDHGTDGRPQRLIPERTP